MSVLRLLDPRLLVPNDANPRTDLDVEDLVASIRDVGLLQALLVVPLQPTNDVSQPVGERFRIIAGHRRHAAALQVGLEQVPCLVAAGPPRAPSRRRPHQARRSIRWKR